MTWKLTRQITEIRGPRYKKQQVTKIKTNTRMDMQIAYTPQSKLKYSFYLQLLTVIKHSLHLASVQHHNATLLIDFVRFLSPQISHTPDLSLVSGPPRSLKRATWHYRLMLFSNILCASKQVDYYIPLQNWSHSLDVPDS